MRTLRFYQTGEFQCGAEVTLAPETFHHAIKVLRLNIRQQIILFNGEGQSALARIVQINKKNCQAIVEELLTKQCESPLWIHLYPALIKSDRMDFMLQKAVELGVSAITPILTDYTDLKLPSHSMGKKHDHWEKVIISACEQCGRNFLPTLHKSMSFAEMLQIPHAAPTLFCHPEAQNSLSALHFRKHSINLIVGPEGGFSPHEIESMLNRGYTGVNLGPRILRAETAAISVTALCQYLWGDLGRL